MPGKFGVTERVDLVRPGAEHGDGPAGRVQRRLMGRAIDALREAGHDAEPGFAQARGEVARVLVALGAGPAAPDHGNAALPQQLASAVEVQHQRRVRRVEQPEGVIGVAEQQDRASLAAGQPRLGPAHEAVQLGGRAAQPLSFLGRERLPPAGLTGRQDGTGTAMARQQPARGAA